MATSREIIAANISSLRKRAGLTQAELALKLNYSDKAISKWERAEAVPDVFVLASIAELFGVTVDYILQQHREGERIPGHMREKTRLRLAITISSIIVPYFLASLVFYILFNALESAAGLWRIYLIPLPVVAVLLLVFTVVWFRTKFRLLCSVSFVLWSVLVTVFVFIMHISFSWFIFILGIPLQLIILQWSYGIIRRKKQIN